VTTASTADSTSPTAPPGRSRRRATIVGVVIVVVLFVIAAVVGQTRSSAPKPPSGNVGTQVDQALPANILSLPLVDEYGNSTNLASFKGKIVVLTDFMTLCQEVCPFTTARLNQVDQAVTKAGLADKVQFVEITVDPERDTPDQLHAYRAFAGLLPNFSLLTGTPDNLATLWHTLGVGYNKQDEDDPPGIDWRTGQPLTYDVEHTDVLLYLDATGHERYVIAGMPVSTDAPLTAGELAFLNDEGKENLTDSSAGVWTADDALDAVSWLAKKQMRLAN